MRMQFALATVTLFSSCWILLAGCRDDDTHIEGEASQTSSPVSIVKTATQDDVVVVRFSDPRELAAYFAEHAEAGNWTALQPLLADEYQAFAFGFGRPFDHYISILRPGVVRPFGTHVEDWDVEDSGTRVVVRLRGEVAINLVLTRLADGTLRIDPGPCALQRAQYWRERPTGNFGVLDGPGYQRMILADDDVLRMVRSNFQDTPNCVSYAEDRVLVTVVWTFREDMTGSVPLDVLAWSAGSAQGPARVIWTDAVVTAAELTFPLPGWAYTITFELAGVPRGSEVSMRAENLSIHAASGPDVVFSLTYRLSGTRYPDPDAPEAPTPTPIATVDWTD